MRKAFVIILAALLVLGLIVSCNDEETIDELFGGGVTVTFNANGGTGTMATLKVRKNAETPLTANAFEKEGYVFTGWNTAADGSGTAYADKSSAKFESDTTLYAQWLQEVTITFDKNGGTGVMPVQKVGKGLATNLDANKFSHTDRYFAGWSSTAAGSVEYADKASVTLTADKTLYAIWSDKPIVTLTSGTGVSSTSGSGSFAPGASVSLDATLATGYKWDKWTQTTGGADVSTTKAYTFTMGTENIAYTANAAPISYTVAFDKNGEGATGTMTSQSFTYDAAQNLSANAFSWESHAFTGWNTKADGSGTSYAAGASVSNLTSTDGDTITLYAQWSEGPNLIKSTTEAITLSSGDYTIEDTTVTVDGRITISGTVNLLLPDGKTLNANSGITVSEGNTLVIDKFDSESTGTGILNATAEEFEWGKNYAGIGGGNGGAGGTITVKYGTVTATGGVSAAGIGGGNNGSGGIITISDTADVTATGGSGAAGIGGGYHGAGGSITISGGTVNAAGGSSAAGIGGGTGNYQDYSVGAGGIISISGGDITATGGKNGAGIGGGINGNGGTLSVSDGTVVANGGENGAGIGGGAYANGGIVTIEGGTVSATGNAGGAGIGGGNNYYGGGGVGADVTISGGAVTATGSDGAAGIGHGKSSDTNGNLTLADDLILRVSDDGSTWSDYVEDVRHGYMKTVVPIILTSTTTSWTDGNIYTLGDENVEISDRITVTGTVNLYLPDGRTLNANSGITVAGGNTLVIDKYGSEATGTGILNATAGMMYGSAGIGGEFMKAGGNITINDGTVTAQGGNSGAGIGGGAEEGGGTTNINGGKVTATGGAGAAGIGGGGENGAGGNITITNGTVIAQGGECASGIGGGNNGAGGNITINGGTVTANGGSNSEMGSGGAGIGGSNGGAVGTITINGGNITSTGGSVLEYGSSGAGIGGSRYSEGSITINSGTVIATGGIDGAGIGSDYYGDSESDISIIINGGEVNATGGDKGAGIGGGYTGAGGNITISGGKVTATGSSDEYGRAGAGIGGGASGAGGEVTITGGEVTATGGNDGIAGIGRGKDNWDSDGTLKIGTGLALYGDATSPATTKISDATDSYTGTLYRYMKAE